MFPMTWNPPYYEEYLTGAGYARAYPFWFYEIDFSSDRYREASRRALADPQAEVRQIDKRRWEEEVELGRVLINEGFADEWEFHQFTPAEYWEFFKPQKSIVNPRLSLIAEVDGEPAGFTFAAADLTRAFHAARGRLGPITILRLMRTARRPPRIGLLAIALRPAVPRPPDRRAAAPRICGATSRRWDSAAAPTTPSTTTTSPPAGWPSPSAARAALLLPLLRQH